MGSFSTKIINWHCLHKRHVCQGRGIIKSQLGTFMLKTGVENGSLFKVTLHIRDFPFFVKLVQ